MTTGRDACARAPWPSASTVLDARPERRWGQGTVYEANLHPNGAMIQDQESLAKLASPNT